MATVNCPYEGCDFPLDLEPFDDGDIFECPECGGDVEVTNNGTKLIEAEDPFDEDEDEEEETEIDG